MKLRALLLLLLLPMCALVQASAAQQAPPLPTLVRSPEILPDHRVTFRLAAPRASEVQMIAEFAKDPIALQKDEKGIWSVTVGPIEPDIYEYEYFVDGVQILDPRNQAVKYNGRPSDIASLLEVPGNGPMFYDARPVPHGTVEMRWYASKATSSVRRVFIYTPPNYEKGSGKLPVLYLLHGADGDESVWTAFGHANQILDNLMADRKVGPMVVVMPFGYAYPPIAGVAADKQRTDFEKDLLEDILPFVQANYRVYADRDHRAVAGLSMGGGQALTIGLHHLDLFSRIAGFSAAVNQNSPAGVKDVVADAKKVNSSLRLLWLGCGTEDGLFNSVKTFSEFLKTSGITHTFRPSPGAHTWINWRRYLLEVAPQLWPQQASSN